MNLSIRYWKHHKGRAAALFGAIMVSTMAMTIGVLIARSASQGAVEERLKYTGNYDLVVNPIEEEDLIKLSEDNGVAEYGIILNGGTCKTEYSNTICFGAMEDENAEALFHFEPEKDGRYPSAPGEICGYRSSFQSLGVAPVLGNSFLLELYDTQGNPVGTKEFIIVGILNESDSHFRGIRSMKNMHRTGGDPSRFSEESDYPEMFVYKDEISNTYNMTALILCDPDEISYSIWIGSVAYKLWEDGVLTWDNRKRLDYLVYTASLSTDAVTENELFAKAHKIGYKDFYSSILMPMFLGIILIVSFISIYGVVSGAIMERQKQLGLYRSIGMSGKSVRKMLLNEAFVFDVTGVATGYVLGILIYLLYLWVVNAVSDVRVYSAFEAHPIARAASLSPYVYPWLFGLIFSVIALFVPMVRAVRLSPNEMLFPEKTATVSKPKKGVSSWRIIPKVTGRRLSGNISVALLIVITGWTFVFGAAFMLGKADQDNWSLYMQLEQAEGMDADYAAQKDIYNTMWGNVLFNRHGEGISMEDMAALLSSEDVDSVSGVMELPGLKLLYSEDEISDELIDALKSVNIQNNWSDFLWELQQKSKAAQGYEEDELLYKLPSVALDADFLKSLSPYVISGELDMEGLTNGTKIVIVEYPDAKLDNPFGVGDKVFLTDVVISDPYVETYDFSHNTIPEEYEPTFYYDYTDGSFTDIPGYSFGEKVVFDAEVCAILYIDDENLQNIFHTENYVYDENRKPLDSPGYGILCCTEALSGWGLQDRCYTKVGVNLKKSADVDRFETLWYTIMGKSGDVSSASRYDIKRSIMKTDMSNLILFVSLVILIALAGCFGMVNTYHFAVSKNTRSLQILRAVGMSRKGLIAAHIKELLLWPLLAIVTSLIPITVFDLVKRYAYYCNFELGNQFFTLDDNGQWTQRWSIRFPWYIEIWKQPIVIIMLIAFACITFLNIAAAVVPLRRIRKLNIVDGIRNEDF
ncbi:MAG: ABC transporter permease [Lachnospiraceae bacterium]|nr:ABC transporter permease [Lachnospiraceae bacterium]